MKKKLIVWLIVLSGATACVLVGLLVIPVDPILRNLGIFLYVYICLEFALQIHIAIKRKKEDKLREEQKTPKQAGHKPSS